MERVQSGISGFICIYFGLKQIYPGDLWIFTWEMSLKNKRTECEWWQPQRYHTSRMQINERYCQHLVGLQLCVRAQVFIFLYICQVNRPLRYLLLKFALRNLQLGTSWKYNSRFVNISYSWAVGKYNTHWDKHVSNTFIYGFNAVCYPKL